jgi:hypothetical protein
LLIVLALEYSDMLSIAQTIGIIGTPSDTLFFKETSKRSLCRHRSKS